MPESTLNLSLDRESEIPVATQLAWKLRAQIAAGAIAPGARLPGVRELAEAAKINVNTARTVYGRLEDEGLIRSEQGRGTFVADRAQSGGDLARIVAEAATAARQSGLDPREVAAALFADISSPPPSGTGGAKRSAPSAPSATPATAGTVRSVPAGGDAALRRGLREQIAQLERELAFNEEAALRADSDEPGS